MLTPVFSCTQDDEFVYINIKLSHVRFDAVGVQIVVEKELFVFSLSPYYLRLRFPHELVDDEERSYAKYEVKEEMIRVRMPKLNKGEDFPDLDLPKKLLARSGEASSVLNIVGGDAAEGPQEKKVLIEEIGGRDEQGKQDELKKIELEGGEFNWEINQEEPAEASIKVHYGFNNSYDSVIGVSLSNGNDINELDEPERTQPDDRIRQRLLKENYKFDPEYYAAEYMTFKYGEAEDNGYISVKQLLQWKNADIVPFTEFSQKENEQMMNLPKYANHLISNPKPIYYTILSLLFSYCFEMRQVEGDLNTESMWTIGKLTPQLAFLDTKLVLPGAKTPMVKAVIITGIRRSLCYPLHRNYELAVAAWQDVVELLKLGKKVVIKQLLKVHELFRFHDVYYVYNRIMLDDLLNWLSVDGTVDQDFVFGSLSQEVASQLGRLGKDEIVFEQLDADGDVDTSLTIAEIEHIAETMYLEGGSCLGS